MSLTPIHLPPPPAAERTVRPDATPRAGGADVSSSHTVRTRVEHTRVERPYAGDAAHSAPRAERRADAWAAPAGTDPELWRALGAEERAFFARAPIAGAPTYGRQASAASPADPVRRGLHLDFRA